MMMKDNTGRRSLSCDRSSFAPRSLLRGELRSPGAPSHCHSDSFRWFTRKSAAQRGRQKEIKTQSCGGSFRFSNQLHGRNPLRSGERAGEIEGGLSHTPSLPHTHSR